jgi:pyridoxamine 5'-phosphate oxidase
MKRLYLLRHAKSSWDEPSLSDRDRPLAPRGRRAVADMAEHLRAASVRPGLVLCSPARRTLETLDAIRPVLGDARIEVDERLYAAEAEDLLDRIRAGAGEVTSIMVIAHNPGIQDLGLALAGGGEALPRLRGKFATGALATLTFESAWAELRPGAATLESFVAPRDLVGGDHGGSHDGGGDHGEEALRRADLATDPFEQFRAWLADAEAAGIAFPEAMALATADARARPAVRHVLLKALDDRGLVFFTNLDSRKGRHLAENPVASAVFLWRELDRQVTVSGPVEPTTPAEADAYFRSRPREARIGAWASRQSAPVGSRADLDAAFADADRRFPGEEVPRPPHWGGFRLLPDAFEFWKGRRFRLHDRFRYERQTAGSWRLERLNP